MRTWADPIRQRALAGVAVPFLLAGCTLKVPIKDPTPSMAAYVRVADRPRTVLFFRDARSPEKQKELVTGRIPVELVSPANTPFEPVSWLAASTVKELTARGIQAELANNPSGAQAVVIRVLQIENHRDSSFSPMKTFTSLSVDVVVGTGTRRIATFVMRRKLPVWSFDEVIDPTFNDPLSLIGKELVAKLSQMLFDARLSDAQVDELIARTTRSPVNSLDVYELGFANNARAIPRLVSLVASDEGDVARAAMSSLGVLRATQHFDLLVKEAERPGNDWEDQAVALKAIADLGTPEARAYLEKVRARLGKPTDTAARRTNALIGLYLDE